MAGDVPSGTGLARWTPEAIVGLGLYLVRTLLARYDGTIELAETGPEGSAFVVELPKGAGEPAASERARTVATDAI